MTLGRVLGLALGNKLTLCDHGEVRQSFESANGVGGHAAVTAGRDGTGPKMESVYCSVANDKRMYIDCSSIDAG